MLVYLYDNINFNKIKFSSKPYKKEIMVDNEVKSIYFIDINYYKKPLYIQLPKLSMIQLGESKIQIKIYSYLYQKFIKQIEELVIDKVYNNSETWFNKRFTMNKIMNSLMTQIHYKNDEFILELGYDKDTIFYNQYKKQINSDEINLPIDIICIIRIENLQFIDNKFTYNIFLEQAKIIENLRLKEYSILQNDSDSNKSDSKSNSKSDSKSDSNKSDSKSDSKSNNKLSSKDTSILDDEYYFEK